MNEAMADISRHVWETKYCYAHERSITESRIPGVGLRPRLRLSSPTIPSVGRRDFSAPWKTSFSNAKQIDGTEQCRKLLVVQLRPSKLPSANHTNAI
jgi:hypothetical protein